jgi:hypothetical protein
MVKDGNKKLLKKAKTPWKLVSLSASLIGVNILNL